MNEDNEERKSRMQDRAEMEQKAKASAKRHSSRRTGRGSGGGRSSKSPRRRTSSEDLDEVDSNIKKPRSSRSSNRHVSSSSRHRSKSRDAVDDESPSLLLEDKDAASKSSSRSSGGRNDRLKNRAESERAIKAASKRTPFDHRVGVVAQMEDLWEEDVSDANPSMAASLSLADSDAELKKKKRASRSRSRSTESTSSLKKPSRRDSSDDKAALKSARSGRTLGESIKPGAEQVRHRHRSSSRDNDRLASSHRSSSRDDDKLASSHRSANCRMLSPDQLQTTSVDDSYDETRSQMIERRERRKQNNDHQSSSSSSRRTRTTTSGTRTTDEHVTLNDPVKQEDGEATVHAMVVEEDEQEVKPTKEEEEARVRRMVAEQAAQLREEERALEKAKRKKKKKKRNRILVILLFVVVLVGGGAAAYFALQNKNSNDGGGNNTGGSTGKDVVLPNSTMATTSIPPTNSPTDSPTSGPTNAPTNAPTELVKYDPPSPEDCKMLADGLKPPGTDTITDIRGFNVDVDLGLALVVEMDVLLPEVEQSVKDWLLLPLVGCPDDSQERRMLMPDDDKEGSYAGMNTIRGGGGSDIITMAQDNLKIRRQLVNIRYMIADVEVQVIDREETCTSPSSSEQCNRFDIKLSLKLRGDETNFKVRVLLADFFPIDQDLRDEIGLASDVIDSFIVRGVRSNDPTTSPSDFPSVKPSVVSITEIPTMTKSANPSFMPVLSPVTSEPTKAQTVAPTKAPSKALSRAPSKAPSKPPTTAPTVAPTPTPPPTAAPAPGVTPNPTKKPTKNPTKNPTLQPSSAPSPSPSDNPSSYPTGGPSASPTSGPTSSPTSNYRGCWRDNAGSAMEFMLATSLITSKCLFFCGRMGYQYVGRSVDHCYCGNQYDSLGESGGCQMSTTLNDEATYQSGIDASSIAVYSTDADGSVTVLEDNLYCGCVQDTPNTLSVGVIWYTHPLGCIQACKGRGHSFAGVREGRKCFCGDSINVEPSFECSTECDNTGYCYGDVASGDGNCKCGGGDNRKYTLFRTSSSVSCPEAGVLTSDYASAYFDIDNPAWPAENGIDGNTDSYTLTDHQVKPSVYTVDLGFYASISKLVVMTRSTHPCPEAGSCGSAYQVWTDGDTVELLDGSRNVISNTERVISGLTNGREVDTNTFTYSGITGARFVRIHIDHAVHLQVAELQAEGVVNDITGTVEPTMSPSTPPPTADGAKYWLGCGKRDLPASHAAICSEDGFYHEGSTAINGYPISARCCRDTFKEGWDQNNLGCSWAQSYMNGICRKYVDYASAKAICENVGGRLCTRNEINRNCVSSSGCAYSWYTLTWTSEKLP